MLRLSLFLLRMQFRFELRRSSFRMEQSCHRNYVSELAFVRLAPPMCSSTGIVQRGLREDEMTIVDRFACSPCGRSDTRSRVRLVSHENYSRSSRDLDDMWFCSGHCECWRVVRSLRA